MSQPTAYNWGSTKTADADYFRLSGIDSSLYTVGYAYQEKPAQQDHNTIFRNNYLWQQYLKNLIESQKSQMLYSSGSATWNGSTGELVLSANLDLIFRTYDAVTPNYGEFINRITAGTITLADGECLVVFRDNEGSAGSPSVLSAVAYASLAAGNYAIVASTSLAAANYENETIVFRRRGTNLEYVLNGLIYPNGSTITFGQSVATASSFSGTLAATNGGTGQSSYTTGDLLYASSSTALSKLAGVATGNSLISGGVGVAPSWGKIGLTTHVSGTLPVANGGTGTTTSTGTGNVVLSASPTFTGTVVIPGCTMSGTWSGTATISGTKTITGTLTSSGGTISGTWAGSPGFSGTVNFSGNITLTGTPSISGAATFSSDLTFEGDLDPSPSGGPDLGSTSAAWNSITLDSGGNNDITLSSSGTARITFVKGNALATGGGAALDINARNSGGTDYEGIRVEYDCLNPTVDNAVSLGHATLRWIDVWALDSTINTSDKRHKDKIQPADLGLDFILGLKPVSFKRKDYEQEIVKKIPAQFDKKTKKQISEEKTIKRTRKIEYKRWHYGLIAQDVKELLGEKDFAGLIYDKETDLFGLRYEEFISPLIKAVQELSQKVSALENKTKH